MAESLIKIQAKLIFVPGKYSQILLLIENFFQIRTYAMGDYDRKNGSKQKIQLTKEKEIELRKLLDKLIG